MHRSSFVLGVGVLAAAMSAATMLLAQSPAAAGGPGDWPLYNRDLAGTRYSPLKEINTSNVSKLAPAWSYTLQAGGSSAVPLVVGGVMFVPSGGRVVALDGVTAWRSGASRCHRRQARRRDAEDVGAPPSGGRRSAASATGRARVATRREFSSWRATV